MNRNEILHLGAEHMEMLVYGYLPVMVTAQCLAKTVDRCRKQAKPKAEYSGGGNPNENIRELTDRYGNPFLVENRCEDCYNIIYNSVPLCLFDEKAVLKEIGLSRLRLQFSVEDGEQTSRILQECIQAFSDGMQKKQPEVTRILKTIRKEEVILTSQPAALRGGISEGEFYSG